MTLELPEGVEALWIDFPPGIPPTPITGHKHFSFILPQDRSNLKTLDLV